VTGSAVARLPFLYASRARRHLHSFPTRRSSDLVQTRRLGEPSGAAEAVVVGQREGVQPQPHGLTHEGLGMARAVEQAVVAVAVRSEEHTSELQSRENLVCRLLLEKKKKT